METSAEHTPTCPSCGQAAPEGHTCLPGAAPRSDDTARIQIPEALRNTGLFRAAWKPTAESEDAAMTGSIFARAPETAEAPETTEAPDAVASDSTEGAATEPSPSETPASEPPAPDAPATDAAEPDPWANLDMTFDVSDTAGEDPWANLTPSTDEAVSVETDELGRDPRLGPPDEDFLFGTGDVTADAVSDEVPAEEPAPIEAAALSPIAAAEAAAHASTPSDSASDTDNSPALDETATYDLEGAFAQEAAAHEALEPVPTPEQSAYDLYGDSLYAPEPDAGPDTAAQGIELPPLTEATAIAAVPSAPASESLTPFASRLSSAGVTSASLPTSVPFAPGAEHAPDAAPEGTDEAAAAVAPKKRRKPVAIVAAVLAVVLVAGGGTWWWSSQKDAPVKDAFAASHDSFVAASGRLDRAASIQDVAAAGAAFEQSLPALNATADAARESGSDLATAARRATLAETAVAEAAAPLKNLSADDLSAWTSAKEPLTEALDALDDVRPDVEAAGGEGSTLPPSEVVTQVQDVIAAEIVDGAAATVVDLGAKLESASVLADIRAVGASAGEYVTALSEAVAGVDDPQQKSDLNSVVEFHEALSDFTKVRSSAFDAWGGLRKDASAAARELSTGTAEAEAGIEAADALVAEAKKKFDAWETKHAAAKAKKAADAQGLKDAVAAVAAADDTYSTLYGGLEDLVNEVTALPSDGTDGEAYSRLDAAAKAREELVASLSEFSLVPNSAKVLDTLVAALKTDAEAVRAAASAAAACVDSCNLSAAPAVQSLGEVTSGAATAWNAALEPWESTTTAAAEKIADRTLPKRPKI